MKKNSLKDKVEENKMDDFKENETVEKQENVEENKEKNKMSKEEKLEQKKKKKEEKKKAKEEKQKETKTEEENIEVDGKKFKKVDEKDKKKQREIAQMEMAASTKRKKIIITVSIITILVILAFVSTIFAFVNINNEKIIGGVKIQEIDVSGLTKEEAKAKIEGIYNEKKEKEINIKYEEYETTLNPTLLEVNYDTEKAVEEAYLTGRNNNIFINNYNILFTLIGKKNINVDMKLNEEVAKQTIEDIGVNLPGIILESSYSVEDDNLIITKGKEGIVVDTEVLLNKVKDNINDINSNQDNIEIPVITKQPEPIDIQKIHDEIYKEAKDAYYTKDPFAVYPEVEGIDFDVETAKALIESEDKEEYTIKLTITKPKVTLSQIGSEAFPNQLSTFTTRYDVSDVDRSENLRLACQKINGKVILSGETFSYNKTLGPRTIATGYKNGKIYSNGEVVDGIGGGICQISSTLYNSVLMANLEIVERRNHQFVTSYVPAGRDATVVYGMTDFKFKNTRQYPVRLVASSKNGIATISIYGIKEENEYTFSFSTKTIASIPTTTKYIEDNTLPVGTEKIKQKGANGLKTQTYITKMLNGKVISTKLLSTDTYDAMQKIILKGTKQVVENTNTNQTTQEPEKPKEDTNITDKTNTPEDNQNIITQNTN